MLVKQFSVQLENAPGKLSELSSYLGSSGINIRALMVAESAEYSTIRMIVDDPEKAVKALTAGGYIFKERNVIAIETPDHPGGLNAFLKPLKEAGINVNYLYSCIGRINDNAIMILGVDRPEEAVKVLKNNWVHLVGEEIYKKL